MNMWCTCGDHSLNLVLHFYATMPRFVGASDVAVESPRHGMVGEFFEWFDEPADISDVLVADLPQELRPVGPR